MHRATIVPSLFSLAAFSCGTESPPEDGTLPTGISASGLDGAGTGGGGETGSETDGVTGGSDGDGAPGGSADDGTGGIKFDAGSPETTGGFDCIDGVGEDCLGCTAVDLLFVVDNSLSMEEEQLALGQAFPMFADTILASLPPEVNLHVGVTSTEMGYSNEGGYDESNFCIGTGVGGAPAANWYQTPDTSPTTTNGAQGRLYTALGMPYFDIDVTAPPAEVQALKDWFAEASHIGEGGSNVEMSAATAAWAMDSAANPGNAGFIRDEGSVLVLFFVQDEPDQTPTTESAALLQKILDAKQGCGGWECVVGGGFVNQYCLPQVVLGDLLDAMPDPPVTAMLPMSGVTPETFEPVLADTLAQVIVEKCGEIEPPG